MSNLHPAERERLRAEIQTAIAAGREVDATMDQHLADSVLDRYSQDSTALSHSTVIVPPSDKLRGEMILRGITTIGSLGIVALILFFNHDLWWIIFPFFGIFGSFWGRGSSRHRHAYQAHAQPNDDGDEDLKRQYHDAKRRLKIQTLENEISRLKARQNS